MNVFACVKYEGIGCAERRGCNEQNNVNEAMSSSESTGFDSEDNIPLGRLFSKKDSQYTNLDELPGSWSPFPDEMDLSEDAMSSGKDKDYALSSNDSSDFYDSNGGEETEKANDNTEKEGFASTFSPAASATPENTANQSAENFDNSFGGNSFAESPRSFTMQEDIQKRSRKRKRNIDEWKTNVRKRCRARGGVLYL